MQRFQYKVVPAPRRGEKAKGAKTTEERFAVALTQVMNALGAEGWDYVRADTLPCDERAGLTGVKTSYQNMLVFRRPLVGADAAEPDAAPMPAALRIAPLAEGPAKTLGTAIQEEGPSPKLGAADPELTR